MDSCISCEPARRGEGRCLDWPRFVQTDSFGGSTFLMQLEVRKYSIPDPALRKSLGNGEPHPYAFLLLHLLLVLVSVGIKF